MFEQTTGDRMISDLIYCRCLIVVCDCDIPWSYTAGVPWSYTAGVFEQTTGDRMICDCDIPWSYTAGV